MEPDVARSLASLAHDFNNLLAVILANTDLGLESLGCNDQEVERDLEAIARAVHRAAGITRRLVELTPPAMAEPAAASPPSASPTGR
jgi:signal transduction histidine kinase